MRTRWLLPMILLAVVLGVTAWGLPLPTFDRGGSYLMVAAAVTLVIIVVLHKRTHKR